MESQPRVSVVIPLHNLRAFVAEAIESVLAQTLARDAFEVIVVDDGSTDGGDTIARGYASRVRYLRQENRGLSAARNAGVAASRAPLLVFLDADDRLRPSMLATALAVFDRRPEADVVYTGFALVDGAGVPLPQRYPVRHAGDVLAELVLGNIAQPNSLVVRRERVERAGGFDEAMAPAADWDLWLRISRAGARWYPVDEPLAEYRIRPGAMHHLAEWMSGERIRALDKLFAASNLPDEVVRRRPRAYQNACLVSAGDHYQAGDGAGGARWFRAAVAAREEFLSEPETLALFCRWLLPMGYQTGTIMAAEWRRLARTLRAALDAVFRAPDVQPSVARRRTTAEIAYWRAILPSATRRARALLGGRRGARLMAQQRRLREFERAVAGASLGRQLAAG